MYKLLILITLLLVNTFSLTLAAEPPKKTATPTAAKSAESGAQRFETAVRPKLKWHHVVFMQCSARYSSILNANPTRTDHLERLDKCIKDTKHLIFTLDNVPSGTTYNQEVDNRIIAMTSKSIAEYRKMYCEGYVTAYEFDPEQAEVLNFCLTKSNIATDEGFTVFMEGLIKEVDKHKTTKIEFKLPEGHQYIAK